MKNNTEQPEFDAGTSVLGLIAGSGMQGWHDQSVTEQAVETPWGDISAPLEAFQLGPMRVLQLARHGRPHRIPPHRVNYRANLWALHQQGVRNVVAINTVGGIDERMGPGTLVLPDQLIDYTWGREHTYWNGVDDEPAHVDFTEPYSVSLCDTLCQAGQSAGVDILRGGVYSATQGPRLETSAEVHRLARDGGSVVGMTGMPEAALARELGMQYACFAVVVNWAAGLAGPSLDFMEIERQQRACIQQVARVICQIPVVTKKVT